jgi:hypothetical protein
MSAEEKVNNREKQVISHGVKMLTVVGPVALTVRIGMFIVKMGTPRLVSVVVPHMVVQVEAAHLLVLELDSRIAQLGRVIRK